MWISKRKWNEMEDRVNDLECVRVGTSSAIQYLSDRIKAYDYLEIRINDLELTHNYQVYKSTDVDGRSITRRKYIHEQRQSTVNTSNIKDITLEELARFVIDHEPIVREENVKVKVEYR